MSIRNLLCFSLLLLIQILGTTENSLILFHFCVRFTDIQWKDPSKDLSSPGWTVPTLSASPHMGNVSDHLLPGSLLYQCVHVPLVLSPELDTSPPELSRRELSHPSTLWQHFYSCSWWHCQPSLTQHHITDLHSTWVSTRTSLLSCFIAGYPLASTGFVPSQVQFNTPLCWISGALLAVSPFLQPDHVLLDGSTIFWCMSLSLSFMWSAQIQLMKLHKLPKKNYVSLTKHIPNENDNI